MIARDVRDYPLVDADVTVVFNGVNYSTTFNATTVTVTYNLFRRRTDYRVALRTPAGTTSMPMDINDRDAWLELLNNFAVYGFAVTAVDDGTVDRLVAAVDQARLIAEGI